MAVELARASGRAHRILRRMLRVLIEGQATISRRKLPGQGAGRGSGSLTSAIFCRGWQGSAKRWVLFGVGVRAQDICWATVTVRWERSAGSVPSVSNARGKDSSTMHTSGFLWFARISSLRILWFMLLPILGNARNRSLTIRRTRVAHFVRIGFYCNPWPNTFRRFQLQQLKVDTKLVL